MTGRITRTRIRTIVATAITTAVVVGGIAWAITPTQPNPADRFYACVSPAGVIRPATLKLDTPPITCPNKSDTVHSWGGSADGGTVFSAAVFTLTTAGCPVNQYTITATQVGTPVPWVADSPCTNFPTGNTNENVEGGMSVHASQLPASFTINVANLSGEMPTHVQRIGTTDYSLECTGSAHSGGIGPAADDLMNVGCGLQSHPLGTETIAAADARLQSALAVGLTSTLFIISQTP